MDHLVNCVSQFHHHIGGTVRHKPLLLPGCPDEARQISKELYDMIQRYEQSHSDKPEFLRRFLMVVEELAEWTEAHAEQDLVAAADAWGDRLYLLIGDAVSCGLPVNDIFAEVHSSNMTKAVGAKSDSGKGIKSKHFRDPKLKEIIANASSDQHQQLSTDPQSCSPQLIDGVGKKIQRVYIVLEQNSGGAEYDNGDGIEKCRTLCLTKSAAWEMVKQMAQEHLKTRGGFLSEQKDGFQIDEFETHGQWEASYTVQEITDFNFDSLAVVHQPGN